MNAVLGDLVFWHLLEEQARAVPVRILKGRSRVALLLRYAARSDSAKQAGTFSTLTVRDPRRNFMFVFYSEGAGAYWVMPSLDLIKEATCNKEGIHAGKYSIMFTNEHKDGKPHPRPRFEPWRNNWDALDAMAKDLAEVAGASHEG